MHGNGPSNARSPVVLDLLDALRSDVIVSSTAELDIAVDVLKGSLRWAGKGSEALSYRLG